MRLTISIESCLAVDADMKYRHMIKYKYVPFDLGKKARYGRK